MLSRTEYAAAQQRARLLLEATGLALRPEELNSIAVVDFGLGALDETGAQIVTLLDTREIAVKLIVLFPWQTLPEHRHPPLGCYQGKVETLRGAWGEAYGYMPGKPVAMPRGRPPIARRTSYTVWHEVILSPGVQFTVPPDTLHWLQGGPSGAVVWSFSTCATDAEDIFTDPEIVRETLIVED